MRSRSLIHRESLTRVACLATLAGLLWIGAQGSGPLPPLGPLIDPFSGVWALARSAEFPPAAVGRIAALGAQVRVVYDDRHVPHIFASSEPDAFRALGYVTARDRLFQLDLQARAGGGTLTELLGAPALEMDREIRGLGLGRAAERLAAALPDSGEPRASFDAYAQGVNAYLDAMAPGELPLEYRLLDRLPTRWSPQRSIQVMLRMGYTLTLDHTDLDHLRAAALVGITAADALFPLHSPIQEPVQPAAGSPHRIPMFVPPPGLPDRGAVTTLAALPRSGPAASVRRPIEGEGVGSNNWAVAPARTRSGAALLAGDPHLELTLPSIWYEARLHVPGSVDVYGVTIPGLPAILIGFNRDVAWTFTNTEADLMDRWAEEVDDSARPRQYSLDGAWVPLESRVETYLGPDGEIVAVDTLRFSHRGPLQRLGGRWFSMRWTTLESGGGTGAFHRAAGARTVHDWLEAMATYQSPPQNMLVADRSGTIGIRSTGRFPIRAGDGRGDRVHDGTSRASDWTGDWRVTEYPQAVSPMQGFLASANQEPQDPRDQHRYLGANWIPPWRALRINALLRADSAVTPETMRQWQTDPASARADCYVPYLVRAAAAHPADTTLAHAGRLLAAWDRRYTRENEGAALFEAALAVAGSRLWDELPADLRPGSGAFVALLEDPANAWWDDRSTSDMVERRDDVLGAALVDGYRATVRAHGPAEFGGWRWSKVHRLDIWHLLRVPALSKLGVDVAGGPSTLSPSSVTGGGEGSSWRMIVELGRDVRGWGTYPGGQSGNPVSRSYDDRLATWKAGQLAELRFPRTAAEVPATSELLLEPGSP
ncbi:MAG TPA: penicillin acylase family protein [Gemmatimonadales bacterium]|nr:penicillin acylase family protein [Gemmatimonadales bacterium]